MKAFLIRNQRRIPYAIAAMGFVALIYILTTILNNTRHVVNNTKGTVESVQQSIRTVEAELEKERKLREERLIGYTTCLLRTPLEQRTDELVADCRESSGLERVPPKQDFSGARDTTLVPQGSGQTNSFAGTYSAYSYPNTSPAAPQPQPEISQNPSNQPITPQPSPQEPTGTPRVLEQITPPILHPILKTTLGRII